MVASFDVCLLLAILLKAGRNSAKSLLKTRMTLNYLSDQCLRIRYYRFCGKMNMIQHSSHFTARLFFVNSAKHPKRFAVSHSTLRHAKSPYM